MFCNKCGYKLNGCDLFCPKCGTAVIVKDDEPVAIKEAPTDIRSDEITDSYSDFVKYIPISANKVSNTDDTDDIDSFSDFIGEAPAITEKKEAVLNDLYDDSSSDFLSAKVYEEKKEDAPSIIISKEIIVANETKQSTSPNDISFKKKPQSISALMDESAMLPVQPASIENQTTTNSNAPVASSNTTAISKAPQKKKSRLSPKKKLAIKITAIVLSFCILLSSISIALVYFNVIDIPFIRKMLNNMGIHDYIAEFNSITGEFTDIKITDDESAIEAARDGAKQLGLEDAVQELSIIYSDDVNGMTYYRIQQHYDGIPVYGKTITVSADEDGTATGFASNIELWTDTSEKSSITTEQAESYFSSYAITNGLSETGSVTVNPFDEAEVYHQTDSGELCLSKQMSVYVDGVPYEGVIDASSGEVYVMNCLQRQDMVQATGTDLDGNTITFDVYQEDDGTYSLMDTERNITVYNANGQTTRLWQIFTFNDTTVYLYDTENKQWYDSNLQIISYDEGIYSTVDGRNVTQDINAIHDNPLAYGHYIYHTTFECEQPLIIPTDTDLIWDSKDSAVVMYNSQHIYDFYLNNFNRVGYDDKGSGLGVVYDDSKNTYCLTGGDSAYILLTQVYMYDLDILAHEYTHSVEKSISGMIYEYESGSIMEGYSDIFGELVEASINKKCNWYNKVRNFMDPSLSPTPKPYRYNGEHWYAGSENKGGAHHNSTVISHAAYLMSKDSENGLLSYDELADLWYNTLYFLPSNCSFMALRDYMEMTAEIIGLSDKKIECIKNAFEEVGIGEQFSYELEVCSQNATISVSDVNGDPYDNYTITIKGAEIIRPGELGETSTEVIRVTDSDPYELDLPIGVYIITISDTATNKICAQKAYKTVAVDSNDELVFASDFGIMDIPESTAIATFENMLKSSGDIWQFNCENGQFTSMSNAEIIENFIVCRAVPIGVYNVYSSEGIQYTAETKEENAYADPKGKFWYSYELDANLVDWILQNVFGKTPDRSITSENVYYNGDKVYVGIELGGDLGYTYAVTDYEKQSDGKYEIYVESKRVDYASEITYLRFIATPKQDSEHGIYWQIHSYEKVDKPTENTDNNSSSNQELFRSYVNNNLSLNKSENPLNDGVFNVLVKDFDSDGKEEMVTFSLRNDDNSAAYLTISLYTVKNGTVQLADTSEEIYCPRVGVYGFFLCATLEGDSIKVCAYDIFSGGSQQTWDFMTFEVNNGNLKLLNYYYSYWFPRYDRFDYIEKVSNRTFVAEDFSTALNNAGYDYSEHFHTASVTANGLVASDLGGNHIFTIVDDEYMVSQYEVHAIYNNTNFIN